MTDSDTTRETLPTTAYLPDHLLAGERVGLPTVRSLDDEQTNPATDASSGDGGETTDEDDPTAELCRSWRRHRSTSRPFPF